MGHSRSYSHSPFLQVTKGSPWKPGGHLHWAVSPAGMHSALGPHGLGLQGSGFSLQPVMVSGAGVNPGTQRHSGLPSLLTEQVVPGPQGEGTQGLPGGGGPTLR